MHECVKCGGRDDLVEQDVGIPSHYCPDYPTEEEYAIGVKEAAKEGDCPYVFSMCALRETPHIDQAFPPDYPRGD